MTEHGLPTSAGAASALVTTTTAMARLGRNRGQVQRLVETRVLRNVGRYGRTWLLDPASLAELAARPRLPDVGNPVDTPNPASAVPYALAVHLGPRAEEPSQFNERDWLGWDAGQENPDEAWTGWWNTGAAIADQVTVAALPILPAVSGFVVDVRIIRGWTAHPVYPGLARFEVAPAPEQLRARYTDTVFTPAGGPPWQRLWRPTARGELGTGPRAVSTAPVVVDPTITPR